MDSVGKSVTVVGLGLLGSAMARAFLRSDYELTVWHRSPSRVAAFEGSANVRAITSGSHWAAGGRRIGPFLG